MDYSFDFFIQKDFNFSRNLIHWHEYFLLIIYVILFYLFAYYIFRKKRYNITPYSKYYFPAFTAKLLGGILICLIYNYYYGGGDTNAYHNDARLLNKVLLNEPELALRIFLSGNDNYPNELSFIYENFRFLRAYDTLLVVKITAIVQLFTFNSFLVTSMTFGFLAFFPLWKLFLKFCEISPNLTREFAYSILFVPSVIMWGSGIFKDTICMSIVCYLFVKFYDFLNSNKVGIKSIILVSLSSIILLIIKAYIFLVLSVCLVLYGTIIYINKFNNPILKLVMTPFLIVGGFFVLSYSFEKVGESNKLYSTDKILETAETTASYLKYLSDRDQSSGYDLGEIEYTPIGILKSLPKGINVTLFRPYPWEAKKIIMLFSAIESFTILLLTLYIIYTTSLINFLSTIFKSPFLVFLFTYSLVFAWGVGITTYNFGSLVRYKIPAISFYLCALFIVKELSKNRKQKISFNS